VKWPRLILFAVLAALGVWAWTALHPGPERAIRKQLEGLARAVSFAPDEGNFAKLARAGRLGDFFSTNVDVEVDVPGVEKHTLSGRAAVQQAALAARATVRGLSVAFPDVTVRVNADKESGAADATLQARVAGEPDLIVQELKFTLRKIEGRWLIVKVEAVRALQ
jgi:hypothetical protein